MRELILWTNSDGNVDAPCISAKPVAAEVYFLPDRLAARSGWAALRIPIPILLLMWALGWLHQAKITESKTPRHTYSDTAALPGRLLPLSGMPWVGRVAHPRPDVAAHLPLRSSAAKMAASLDGDLREWSGPLRWLISLAEQAGSE